MSRHGDVCSASAAVAHHAQACPEIIGVPKRLPMARNASPSNINTNAMDGTSQTCVSDPSRALSGGVGAAVAGSLLLVTSLAVLLLFWKRRQTYQRLVRCGLPTVYWHPKFSQYQPDHPKHLSSSSITNILPRMERLKGPFGAMYGTVYGVSTAVIHVAHPVPAMILLGATASSATAGTPDLGTGKTPAYNHFLNFCGQGVFTADGKDWRTKRAAVLHSLLRSSRLAEGGSKSASFHECIEQATLSAATLMSRDLELAMARANDKGLSYSTDIVPHLQRATVGLIYKYITHSDLLSLENGNSKPVDRESGKEDLISMYLRSITKIRMIILAQSRSIWFLLPRWFYTTFASLYQQEEQTMGPIRKVAAAACASALPNSPLRLLLERHPIYSSVSGEMYSKNLLDEAITLLFAGQDTSAATLSWTLHLLTLYPEVQSKLANEVRNVVEASSEGKSDCGVVFTKKAISQMPYMDAIIKESMRLYPVAPFVVRKLGSNVTIPATRTTVNGSNNSNSISTDFSLPKNSLACIWIYSLHRNPEFWNQPDEFQPERWLCDESMSDLGTRTPGAYIPFAAGPRNCIGQPLANVMLRCFLAQLIDQYEFSDERVQPLPRDGIDIDERLANLRKEMQAGFTVLPRGGLFLTIRHRSNQAVSTVCQGPR